MVKLHTAESDDNTAGAEITVRFKSPKILTILCNRLSKQMLTVPTVRKSLFQVLENF